MNEHGLKNNKKLNINNYKSVTKNRVNQNMGGVSTSIINSEKDSTIKVMESDGITHVIVTKLAQVN